MAVATISLYLAFCLCGTISHLTAPVSASGIGGVSIAFCKVVSDKDQRFGFQNQGWKRRLQDSILEIPFRVDPVACGDVGGAVKGMALMIRYGNTGKSDTVIREKGQTEVQFIAAVINKISPGRLSPLKKTLKKTLSGVKQALVGFVLEDTTEDLTFHQLLLSNHLPKNLSAFKVTDKSFLPSDMQEIITQNLHVWLYVDGHQSHIPLPYSNPNKIKPYLDSVFARLKLPHIVKYESDDVYKQYERRGFNFFTVYHHTDQEDDVYRTLINPLANIFRPYFVFVSVDINNYQLPQTVDSDGPFPLVVITKYTQRDGVTVKSTDIPYTIEGLRPILHCIIDPEIDNDSLDDNMFGEDVPSLSDVIIPSSITSLTSSTREEFISGHDSLILGFYLPYTLGSKMFLNHVINTNEDLQSAGMPIALVNCLGYPDICESFNIIHYPAIKYRRDGGDWITYKGVVNGDELLALSSNGVGSKDNDKIVELNPSSLVKLMQSEEGLHELVIVVADRLTPELRNMLTDWDVYWLNSTQYEKLSSFFNGGQSMFGQGPVIVWADYTKNFLYRLDMSMKPPNQEEINEFLTEASSGKRTPDNLITPAEWKPTAPAITFPSNHFLALLAASEDSDKAGSKRDGDKAEINLALIDKQPLYADPNRHSLDRMRPIGQSSYKKPQKGASSNKGGGNSPARNKGAGNSPPMEMFTEDPDAPLPPFTPPPPENIGSHQHEEL